MKTVSKAILVLIVSTLVLVGCSRKKNTFLSRNFHAVTAEYNVLYNGYNDLNEGVNVLNENYQDDYWEILPIERMQIREEISLASQNKNANFETAEEKAVKAIQKHSINVKGREYNPQMDEAYLLLGKARYYDQRFVPALDAFNNILNKYPTSDKINQVKIWRAKTNIRLENNEMAIKILKRLLKFEELDDQDLADATSMLAQAYLNTKSVDTALMHIKTASAVTKKNEEKGRFNFIKGQLYNALGQKDSANMAFDAVIELHRKIPRIYYISAHLEKIKNYNFETGNKLEFIEHLRALEENRENRPYLDRIYYETAQFYNADNSDSLAVRYYNKSLRTNSSNKKLIALNYQQLAEMYFDNSQYKFAGNYYDSTMLNLNEKTKLYRIIKRNRDNLKDVIFYEGIVQKNDSILNLVNLPENERLAVFQALVDDIKAKEDEQKLAEEAAERRNAGLNTGIQTGPNTLNIGNTGKSSNTFYFYNPTTVAFGKNEFVKIWGNRAYDENWRWSNSGSLSTSIETSNAVDLQTLTEDQKYDPMYYVSLLPSEQKEIDSITKERNFSDYQLGLIYKDKFKEYDLAKTKLKKLLGNNPEERLILPAKYNLYKVYLELGQMGDSELVKNEIISNYPDSRYAAILSNPEINLGKDENSPESIYENLLELHQDQDYKTVVEQSEAFIKQFEGEPIIPKFEFLKTTAKGRLYGFEAYKEGINYIALNYPNTPEGKQAEILIQQALPKISNPDFVDESTSNSFKVVYSFTNTDLKALQEFEEKLTEAIKLVKEFNLTTSIDVYDENIKFVVLHGLKDKERADGVGEILDYKKYKINKEHFVISAKNYEVIQIHKNLQAFLESQ